MNNLLRKEKNDNVTHILNKNETKYFDDSNKNVRNYGIDLLRIFSTINIIVLHINKASKELNYNHYSPRFNSIWLSETMAYWGVNGFGIISGIVGYKKHKFSNLIFIWFQTFFYSVTTSFYNYLKTIKTNKQILFLSFFPIYTKYHWYVNAYACMYPFLPFINCGINNIDRVSIRNFIIIIICFFSIYDIIVAIMIKKNNYNYLNSGYSPIWLIILYIVGGYLGKFIVRIQKNKIMNYIFWLLIYFLSSFFSYYVFLILLKKKYKISYKLFICYISPTILIQALSLILIFSRLNIHNFIIKKFISFLTPLTFNIILIHSTLLTKKYSLTLKFLNYFKELNHTFLILKTYGLALLIYFFCAFIDYFRFLIFKKIKIKELCLFIEKISPKIIDKIINLCSLNL